MTNNNAEGAEGAQADQEAKESSERVANDKAGREPQEASDAQVNA